MSMTSGKYDNSKARPTQNLRSGVFARSNPRPCLARRRSMTAAYINKDAICRAFGAIRRGIYRKIRCILGPRSHDSAKGPQKSPHERVAVKESRWISMDYPIALLTRIGGDFFGVVDTLGCPWTLLDGGPARTRTEDQGIHFCPAVSGGSGLSLHPSGVRDALACH